MWYSLAVQSPSSRTHSLPTSVMPCRKPFRLNLFHFSSSLASSPHVASNPLNYFSGGPPCFRAHLSLSLSPTLSPPPSRPSWRPRWVPSRLVASRNPFSNYPPRLPLTSLPSLSHVYVLRQEREVRCRHGWIGGGRNTCRWHIHFKIGTWHYKKFESAALWGRAVWTKLKQDGAGVGSWQHVYDFMIWTLWCGLYNVDSMVWTLWYNRAQGHAVNTK